MTQSELDASVALFKEHASTDPRSQPGSDAGDFTVLPGKISCREVIDHKIVLSSFNSHIAVVKCRYEFTLGGVAVTRIEWVAVGALLYYAVNFSDTWAMLRTYMLTFYSDADVYDESKYHPELFSFLRVKSGGKTSRKTAAMGLISYEYDPDSETVHAFSGDTRKPMFRDKEKFIAFSSAPIYTNPLRLENADVLVPKDYPEVLRLGSDVWRRATDICIRDFALADIGDWVRIRDVKDKLISSRFVYQCKTRLAGNLEAFCRWTPRGYEEEPITHFDPDLIFAGTPQLWGLRLILVMALYLGWKTYHLDFKRAFSHAPIDRPVYCKLPRGYHKYDSEGYELCICLRKSSEGLKQSAANWDKILTAHLLSLDFENCIKEPHVWRSPILADGSRALMCIYVDDIYLTCDDADWVTWFRGTLEVLAPHKSLGEISYALGCEITRTDTTVTVAMTRKITELLRRTGMEDCKSATTPLRPGSKLKADMDTELITDHTAKKEYQKSVGSLIYIQRGGRPDLGHASWYLACGMTSPTVGMVKQLRHTLRYLNGSKDFVLRYSIDRCSPELDLSSTMYSPDELVGFCDANFEPEEDRCVGCCMTMFLNAVLYWRVKKITGVQLSTVQAELTTLSELARDAELLHDLFEFCSVPVSTTSLFCDNQGAIQNAKHPTFSEKLRHAANKIFYVRNVIQRKVVAVRYIPGILNPADIGTKCLGAQPFRLFAQFIMNFELSAPTTAQLSRAARNVFRAPMEIFRARRR